MAKKKAATRRTASVTASAVKQELVEVTRQLNESEQSQSELKSQLDTLRDEFVKTQDEIQELKQRPEFDASSLDPMKTDLAALADRAKAAEARLAEAEARTKEANDSAAAALSSAAHAAREVDQVRSSVHLTWGVALVLAIFGYFCWNGADEAETKKTPAPQVTSGDLLAIDINTDDKEPQRVYARVQVDGTIQAVSHEARLNVAGLEVELARRLVEAHVQSVIPMATVSLRAASDDEVAMWKSMKRQQEGEEREEGEWDDDEAEEEEWDDDMDEEEEEEEEEEELDD